MVLTKKRKSKKQRMKSKLRKKHFVKQKLINLKITNWYRKRNIQKLEKYFFNIWGDILAAKKYTHLFLKYYIPTDLNKIKSKHNDYGSNIMLYRYNQNDWLKHVLDYYLNMHQSDEKGPDKLKIKLMEMFKLYKLFETKPTYQNFIENLENKFLKIAGEESPSQKKWYIS